MAQWLRELAALVEGPSLISSTHMGAHNNPIPVPGDPTPPSDLHRHYTYVVQRYTCKKTPTHIKKNFKSLFKGNGHRMFHRTDYGVCLFRLQMNLLCIKGQQTAEVELKTR